MGHGCEQHIGPRRSATLQLTAENLPELALIEGIQQVAMKREESRSPSLFTFRSRLTVVHHH